MDLEHYADQLRQQFLLAAEAHGDEALGVAERLVALLDSAVQVAMLGLLSEAADELTRDLAPDTVELRLRGMAPSFAVTRTESGREQGGGPVFGVPDGGLPAEAVAEDSTPARINFRPPEHLKVRVEEAAQREGLSVNAWLVRVTAAALSEQSGQSERGAVMSNRLRGWVR
ncbi:hypothetical protein [Lentzea flaviverrucosa]|uniref:HicB family protein n=1 Tax=Lentzea flaviverrucosa TaxID=200379 RepID=A0A1H9SEE3_9PSEU|nr:hypothetical protein [Lentzea flaviverrucosa]RDI25340.1 hypothetical protein DFR72_10832 [Lentzea flaviverrucosa]SER83382.1 hypothetical protein SAMN05216195_10733 [Lentzea flaviverrucosa]